MEEEISKCADVVIFNGILEYRCPQCKEKMFISNDSTTEFKCPYCNFKIEAMIDNGDDLVVL